MPESYLDATNLGPLVQISQAPYSVLGVYKNGTTLANPDRKLIFLTENKERGPFHIVVPGGGLWFQKLVPGYKMIFQDQIINFPELRVQISIENAQRWSKYSPPRVIHWKHVKLAVQQTITNISTFDMPHNAIINEIDWGGKNLSFSQKSDLGSNSKENQIVIHHLKLLHQAFRAQDMDNAIKESLSLLGLGSGLTPSGDDILAGILAVFYDVSNTENPRAQWADSYSKKVVSMSKSATNVISAAFISAAAIGETNETLMLTKACLLEGKPPSIQLMKKLKKIGHTSGVDGLVGILLGLISTVKIY